MWCCGRSVLFFAMKEGSSWKITQQMFSIMFQPCNRLGNRFSWVTLGCVNIRLFKYLEIIFRLFPDSPMNIWDNITNYWGPYVYTAFTTFLLNGYVEYTSSNFTSEISWSLGFLNKDWQHKKINFSLFWIFVHADWTV